MLLKVWFDNIPLWLLFPLTVLTVIGANEVGYRIGIHRRRHVGEGVDAPVGSVIAGTLGLLAFLLAFTFGMAASRFDMRRELLLEEVNAIETCYLRANLVTEPENVEIRKRLREYVHLRATVLDHPESFPQMLARTQVLQDELWAQTRVVAKKDSGSEMHALFVEALNDVLDYHTKRLVVSRYRIPGGVWLALYLVSILSIASVGYQFGRAGSRDLAISLFLALSFSVVICLTVDLDRIDEGSLQVSQEPMIDLDKKLQAAPP